MKTTIDTLYDFAARQGWGSDKMLIVLADYVDYRGQPDAFCDYRAEQASTDWQAIVRRELLVLHFVQDASQTRPHFRRVRRGRWALANPGTRLDDGAVVDW